MDESARRPSLTVEEVPSTLEPPPFNPEVQPGPLVPEAPVVETVPQISPEPLPSVEPLAQTPPMPPQPSNEFNVIVRPHPVRKLLFLIPAILIVATIYFVARVTGNNYTLREPEPTVAPSPTAAPTVAPTPTPAPVKQYKNTGLFIEMTIPDDYEVLSEDETSVSFGRAGTELFVVRTDEFTNYDEEDETTEVLIGGKEAVELELLDEGSVPVKFIQTLGEPASAQDGPKYEFVMYYESEDLAGEFKKITESVIFLVDTSDWETFENTTFNYTIKYPPEWEVTAVKDEEGVFAEKSEISKDPANKTLNNLVIQTSSNLNNAALTASEIISSTRNLSGWSGSPKIELKRLGGGDAQVIQGELTGKWRAYVVIWYKNSVVQMTWDDATARGEQQVFDNILASFEFTN